jgi:hypothetical protein
VVCVADWSESKKLRGAGAYWAGERVVDETADDLRALGASVSDLESIERKEEQSYPVWEEHYPALDMFLRLQTQWIVTGMGEFVGLNYQSVEFLFRIYDIGNPRELLADLREIEFGALEAISRERKRAKP